MSKFLGDFVVLLKWAVYYRFFVREKPSPKPIPNFKLVKMDRGFYLVHKDQSPRIWITPVAPTNSMDPWFDEDSLVVLIDPAEMGRDVEVGDVVVYAKDGDESQLIIHQIVERGEDSNGPYFVTMGINNWTPDAFRVRKEWVKWVLAAVVYSGAV